MSQTEELSRREEQFLENVLENLRQRIRKIAQELEESGPSRSSLCRVLFLPVPYSLPASFSCTSSMMPRR